MCTTSPPQPQQEMPTLFLLALLTSAKIAEKKYVDNADAEDEVFEPSTVHLPSVLDMAGVRTVLPGRGKPRTKGNIRLPWPLLGQEGKLEKVIQILMSFV